MLLRSKGAFILTIIFLHGFLMGKDRRINVSVVATGDKGLSSAFYECVKGKLGKLEHLDLDPGKNFDKKSDIQVFMHVTRYGTPPTDVLVVSYLFRNTHDTQFVHDVVVLARRDNDIDRACDIVVSKFNPSYLEGSGEGGYWDWQEH